MNEGVVVKIEVVYEIVKKITSKSFKKKFDKKTNEKLAELQKSYLEKGEIKALCEIGSLINEKYKLYAFQLFHYCGVAKGELEGLYNLGSCYWFGRGTKADTKKSFKIFRDLYKKKYSHASFILATIYNPYSDLNKSRENRFIKDGIIKPSIEKALWYYKKAAEYKPTCSEYMLFFGKIMYDDKIVKRNVDYAKEYFIRCVENGTENERETDFFAVKALLMLSKIEQEINGDFKMARKYILQSQEFGNKNIDADMKKLNKKIRVRKDKRKKIFKPKLKLDRLLEQVYEMDEVHKMKFSLFESKEMDVNQSQTTTPPPTPIDPIDSPFNMSIDTEEVIDILKKFDIDDIKSPKRSPPEKKEKNQCGFGVENSDIFF